MKTKTLTFTPGSVADCAAMPQITLPDGSAILLYRFDPACGPRQHKRRAKRLPTLDTRNQMGALFAAAPELLAAAVAVQEWAEKMGGWEAPCWDKLRAAIAKATPAP